MSDGDSEVEFVPYKNREEWKDVQPIEQDDGPNPVASIAYSDDFKDVMGYFRAVVAKEEYSLRVMGLLDDVLELNPANYTAWQYRRTVIEKISYDFQKEFAFLNRVSRENPKNYQVWHHRQVLIEKLNDIEGELEFTEAVFRLDSKNYHAWAYRQWLIERFEQWDVELAFTEQLIALDVRNNSAWNQRFYVVSHLEGSLDKHREEETAFAQRFILKAPNNESPWNYLKGLYPTPALLASAPQLKEWVDETAVKCPACLHAVALQLDILIALGHTDSANQLCEKLSLMDPIRVKYWKFRASSM